MSRKTLHLSLFLLVATIGAVPLSADTIVGSVTELDACCQDGFWTAGERLEYAFLVTNDTTDRGLRVDATIPADTTIIPGSVTASLPMSIVVSGNAAGDTRVLVDFPSLSTGESNEIRYRVRVGDCFPEGIAFLRQDPVSLLSGPAFDFIEASAPVDLPTASHAAPDLSLAKSDGGITATVGDVVAYSLSFANAASPGFRTGPATVLEETVPQGSVFSPGASSPGWTCVPAAGLAGAACTLPIGVLACDATGGATFAVEVAPPFATAQSELSNSATLRSALAAASGSDTTPLAGIGPDAAIAKTASRVSVGAGQTIVYTLVVSNAGNAPGEVTVTETVPPGTSFLAGSSTPGWSCAAGACTFDVGVLPPGVSMSLAFAVTTASPLPSGLVAIHNNARVEATGDLSPANDLASASVSIDPSAWADLEVTKTSGSTTAVPGQVIVYTLEVTNGGHQVAGDVVLTETVSIATTFEPASSSAGWACLPPPGSTGAICTLELGDLAPGVTATRAFAVRIDDPLASGVREIANRVTVSSPVDPDGDPGDGPPPVITPIDPASGPDLQVTKTAAASTVGPGDLLVYTLRVTNSGDQVAGRVILTETVPAATTFEPSASSIGWSCAPPGGGAGSSCALALGNVVPGAVVLRAFAVRVDDPLPAGAIEIANSVTVSSSVDPDTDPGDDPAPVIVPIVPGPPPPPPDGPDVIVAADGNVAGRTWTVTGFVAAREALDVPVEVTVSFDPTLLEPVPDPPELGVDAWNCEVTPSGVFVGRCTVQLPDLQAEETVELPIAFEALHGARSVWAIVEAWPVGVDDVVPGNNVATVEATITSQGIADIPVLDGLGMAALVLLLFAGASHVMRRTGSGPIQLG